MTEPRPGGAPARTVRFCMITTFYPPFNFGGDGIGIQHLARGLARRGHHVTVVHDIDAYRALGGEAASSPEDGSDGIERIGLQSGAARFSSLVTQQTGRPLVHWRSLQRVVDGGRFDVINYHNVSLVGGPGVLSLGDAVKVYMAHEHWLVCPTHVLWRHRREPCPGRQCIRCTLRYRRPPQVWRYTGYLERQLKHIDSFIAMSEFSRDKHREFGFPREMEVVPYLLPDEEPDASEPPDELPSPAARPFFLFVGRLERIKGLDDVIPLFRERDGADLVIAGAGEHEGTLRQLAGGSPRIRFVGRLSPDELRGYYRHALALVMPSVCYETFGITLIEAFRQSLPVIARRIGPLPEIVAQSAGGGEVFGSATELEAVLDRLEGDPELRATMGRAARNAFVERWTEGVVIPRYLDVVARAAESRGRREVAEAVAA